MTKRAQRTARNKRAAKAGPAPRAKSGARAKPAAPAKARAKSAAPAKARAKSAAPAKARARLAGNDPAAVFCRRVQRMLPVTEHSQCVYCYGGIDEIRSQDHERFCDFQSGEDPIVYGFPATHGRHQHD